ncbi:pyridoxamine 5'-phosphate oxidase family protein [Gorillibacterium sp. sgz5001074]|uniref:pyridoxamine 5'-phosphate oxidase family protein n=1 Tax=Gorillibacterium sp. sgz5001074 TaxID=3446695 RepID=UPI003F67E653
MAETVTALNEQLFSILQNSSLVILNTMDAETGAPGVNAISWVYAKDPGTIRFAVDGRSRIIANVKAHPRVAVSLFAAGTLHAIHGEAAVVTEELENVPFKLACIDIGIREVRDAMFYGARVSVEPEVEKTYDKRAADKLDGQVFEAMRKA